MTLISHLQEITLAIMIGNATVYTVAKPLAAVVAFGNIRSFIPSVIFGIGTLF